MYIALTPLKPHEYLWLHLPLCKHSLFVCVLCCFNSDSPFTFLSLSTGINLQPPTPTLFLIRNDFNIAIHLELVPLWKFATNGFSISMCLTQSMNFLTWIYGKSKSSLLDLLVTHFIKKKFGYKVEACGGART